MVGNFYTVTLEDVVSWPAGNYDNPSQQQTWLPIYAIIWTILTTIFVVGRLYIRFQSRWGMDDVCLVISWAFAVAFTAVSCIAVYDYDIGRHIWDVRPDRYIGALYYGWIAQVLFANSTCAIKIAVLVFYARIARSYSRWWLYTIWTLLAMTLATWASLFVAYCFICQPLSVYWRIHVVEALGENYTCLDGNAMTISVSVLTIASDIWTVAVPCVMFQYHDLGVAKRQKVALNIIFCLGFLCIGPAIARTYYLWKMGHEDDLSWNGSSLFAASIAEIQLAIMCTCAPFLRAFFRRYFPGGTYGGSKSRGVTSTVTGQRLPFTEKRISLKPLSRQADVTEIVAPPSRRLEMVGEDTEHLVKPHR